MMVEFPRPGQQESPPKPDDIIVVLFADNGSELAHDKINRWYFNYESGLVVLERDCSDARLILDEETVSEESSVSTGFPHKEEFARKYNNPRFRALVNKSHFDGVLFRIGERPVGCGGQDTKAKIRQGHVVPSEGITEYVNANVHEDPIVQSLIQARETAYHLSGNGRVFVVTQDHRSGLVYPVGEYTLLNGIERRQIPAQFRRLLEARGEKELERLYNPAEIYAEGIPSLPKTGLVDEFQEYLARAERKMLEVNKDHPDLSELQAVQNPLFLAISTNKIPLQVRYPGIFGTPGSVYKFHIPQTKSEQVVNIDQKSINEAIANMQYAIEEHAIKNAGDPSLPFSKTRIMLIETGAIGESAKIAAQLRSREWFQKWLALGSQVILAYTKGGNTLRLEAA